MPRSLQTPRVVRGHRLQGSGHRPPDALDISDRSNGAHTIPHCFVLHFRHEALQLFLACITKHSMDHCEGEFDGLHANRSFVRAIELAEECAVSIVDENGETYSKAWCTLEIHVILQGHHEFCSATSIDQGRVAADIFLGNSGRNDGVTTVQESSSGKA